MTTNPTVDVVIALLVEEMEKGSRLHMVGEALTILNDWYRTAFQERLGIEGTWHREGTTVRNAAHQLGIIAASIASLHQRREVGRPEVEAAARVVEQHCAIGFEEGRWCRQPPS
jgi:hypothetical protein